MVENKKCKYCQSEINKEAKICPNCKKKQSHVTRNIILGVIGFILFWSFIISLSNKPTVPTSSSNKPTVSKSSSNNSSILSTSNASAKKVEVTVVDFSSMTKEEIQNWCNSNNVKCSINEEYSNVIAKGQFIKQSVEANKKIYQGDKIIISYSLGKEPSIEEKNALKKAESYSNTMHMSKKGIYDQLVSEYGEQFSAEAAQYAIDNMKADWNANALAKAKSYQSTMSMSKNAIYDQLISEYGEQFTKEEAQYAIDNLE